MEKGPFTTDDEDILSEASGDEVEGSGELPGTADARPKTSMTTTTTTTTAVPSVVSAFKKRE